MLSTLASRSLHIQVDLLASENLAQAREQFELLRPYPRVKCLSDAVNPLIIDPQGRWFAFAYGMHPRLELGRVRAGERIHPSRDVMEATFQLVEAEPGGYTDCFSHLAHLSRLRTEAFRRGVEVPALAGAT